MPVLSFGEFRPDISDYRGEHSTYILNAVPRGDGYGPVQALSAFTAAQAATCRGMFLARKNDGTVAIFAGTLTKLYLLNNTTGAWTDVSKAAGTYTALSGNDVPDNWSFAQFNNFVFAVQGNTVPQVYDLTSSTAFADLGGTPPNARYISVVNRFVVLSGITSGSPANVYRIQWSGLNATTTWTSGVSQSDFQDLADGGIVRGVAGGEFGVIFQDTSIRRMTYSPGSPYIFGIDRISADDGLYGPYSLVSGGDRVFFCSPQGFKMLLPGGYPQAIGKEKIDRTFFADVDTANLQLFIGAHDPRQSRVFWAYKSINGTTGQFDTILCYDWLLDKWSKISLSGEFLASISKPGVTLEGVDTSYGSNIDTLTISSLDVISNAAQIAFAGVDTNHKAGFFTGANLEATLETPEQGVDTRRIFVRGFRPVTDAPGCFGSLTYRETAQATATTSTEQVVDSIGTVPQRVDTRYARGRLRIPAGTSWTYAAGVEPDVAQMGER